MRRTDKYPNIGNKLFLVMWKDLETSLIQLGPPIEKQQSTLKSSDSSLPICDSKDNIISNSEQKNAASPQTMPSPASSNKTNPKKNRLIGGSLIALLILLSILVISGGKKFSGSYECGFYRYDFILSDTSQGSYGGQCNRYSNGELNKTYSWYFEDNIIYLDGKATFGYLPAKDFIVDLYSATDIKIIDEPRYLASVVDGNRQGLLQSMENDIIEVMWMDDLSVLDYLLVGDTYYGIFGGPV